MITFQTNGQKGCTTVFAMIDPNIPNLKESLLRFRWEASDEMFASLLVTRLHEEQERLIKKAHKDAYELGYKDGRGRKKKKTWFAGWFCIQICCTE